MSHQTTISRMGSKVSSLASFFERKPTVQAPKPIQNDKKDDLVKNKDAVQFSFNIFKNLEKSRTNQQPIQPIKSPKKSPIPHDDVPKKSPEKVLAPQIPSPIKPKAVNREHTAPQEAPELTREDGASPDLKVLHKVRDHQPVEINERAPMDASRKRNASFKSIKEGIRGIINGAKKEDGSERSENNQLNTPEKESFLEPHEHSMQEMRNFDTKPIGPVDLKSTTSFSLAKHNYEAFSKALPKRTANPYLTMLEDTPPTPIVESMNGTIEAVNIPPVDLVKTFKEKTELFIGQHEHYIALTNPFWTMEKEPVYNKLNRNLFKKVDYSSFEKEMEGKLNKMMQ